MLPLVLVHAIHETYEHQGSGSSCSVAPRFERDPGVTTTVRGGQGGGEGDGMRAARLGILT